MAGQEGYRTAEDAAEYIQYSVRHFWRLVSEHGIPTYGPANNRFRISDLDTFMENPQAFKSTVVQSRRRGGFTKVSV